MVHRRLNPALLALLALLALSGLGCGIDDRPRISIEFGMYPEEFGNAGVQIDGVLVGELERTGQATRISFPVKPGVHEVLIRHPRLPGLPTRVEARLPGERVHLMADIREVWADGKVQARIVLDG